jgi:CheY-like chemotaxis protein
VDDDPHVVDVEKTRLEQLGAQVLAVQSISDAMEVLAATLKEGAPPLDLALVNFCMPKASGLDLAEYIRDNEMNIPVVIISSHVGSIPARRFRGSNIYALLDKPTPLSELILVFSDALQSKT